MDFVPVGYQFTNHDIPYFDSIWDFYGIYGNDII